MSNRRPEVAAPWSSAGLLPNATAILRPGDTAPVLLQVRDVTQRYGAARALDGLSLAVRRGETLGLLGPNGAGKTTLMHLMAGVLAPTGGTVLLDGRGSPSSPATRRRIGIAPQDLALYTELTAEENLRFFARLYGLRGRALSLAVERALALAELTARRHHRVHTFSGGMQRRLNLACAVVHGPDLVLLDEPTVGVDPQSRGHVFDSLERLKALGHTLVYSTHYMEEAERLCDRIAVIDHGRLLACGTLHELVRRHGGGHRVRARLTRHPDDVSSGTIVGDEQEWVLPDAAQATELALKLGSSASSLAVRPPDLETVFFTLTGRSLRD
ncbi:MAG: ABC transporter ATP-binding protein [Polyangiaceae bacterium]|nr:ABC transporter ATP-binding protein [Polyangiaceae bacterium]